jgi:HK97 family phage portal protein
MANPIIAFLRGDHLARKRQPEPPPAPAEKVLERKLYLYPDYLNPVVASDPDIYAAIRMGTLVHGPGATELTYGAWHYNDANSAVFACLSAIATAYPEAPAKVYKNPGPDQEDLPDHPLKQLLDRPNPYISREDLWHYTQWCKHVSGNAYWRKIRSAGPGTNVIALWPISPMRIQPVTTKADAQNGIFISYYAYSYDPSQDPEQIPAQDIVHFRLGVDDKDHRVGCSPLARLVREVAGDDEAHSWQAAMLSNGGSVGMLIQVPIDSNITQDQAEEMKARFEERFGGNNRGRTGVLMGGASAQPYGFSPEQMDMKQLHRIPEERISAVLRVPAIIAGLGAGLDRSTYANFREAREMFAEMTLLPLYYFDAATLNMQLTPEFTSDPHTQVIFDTTDLRALQEDEDAKYQRLDLGVRGGWIRKNEARTDVGLPPDMDETPTPPPPSAFGAPATEQQPAAAAGTKQMHKPHIPPKRATEMLPDVLDAIVRSFQPGTQADLEDYFAGQQERVQSALTEQASV